MRKARISSYQDYVAVDVVDFKNNILSTQFYLKAGEEKEILYQDQEEHRWLKTIVRISDDGKGLICKDSEGMEWQSDFSELEDSNIIKFK